MNRKIEEPKQIIVVRKDLKMTPGKLSAQVSHASLGALFQSRTNDTDFIYIDLEKDSAIEKWLNERFTKVVVYVKSEQALINVYEKAKAKGLNCVLIKDSGFTEFDEPTLTCVGIGPHFPSDFDGVTNKLRLLQGEVIYN